MSKKVRNTHVKRGRVSDAVRVAIWARSAGLCNICNQRLIGSKRTYFHSALSGELAHNVGATATDGSPRGNDEDIADREAEENLLLLCHDCHRIVDHKASAHLYPIEKLRALKASHENRIEKVTANGGLTRTAAIRLGSNVRGSHSLAPRRVVGEVLIEDDYLALVESQWSGDFTCELPGDETDRSYWLAAQDAIDKTMSTVKQAIEQHDVEHVSVFAIAPIPALVYFGSTLDDKVSTRLYQLSRDPSTGWRWTSDAPPTDFTWTTQPSDTEDVVLVCSISAPVAIDRLPDHLHDASRLELHPADGAYSPTAVAHEETLRNFGRRWRELLAEAERLNRRAKRWHLVSAVPVSVAVEIGRSFMREAQPPVTVYQRAGDNYEAALDVNA